MTLYCAKCGVPMRSSTAFEVTCGRCRAESPLGYGMVAVPEGVVADVRALCKDRRCLHDAGSCNPSHAFSMENCAAPPCEAATRILAALPEPPAEGGAF